VKRKFRIYLGLVFTMIFLFQGEVSGQKKTGDIYFGMGFPELANIGVRYKVFKQIRTGLSAGWLPRSSFKTGGWDDMISLSGDIYFHFGRTPDFSDLRLFYVRIGLNCIMQKPYRKSENWWNSCFRVGGEIFSTKNFGVTIDGGFMYNMNPETNWAHMEKILPSFGTGILYRF
jgi:hypothetical protein